MWLRPPRPSAACFCAPSLHLSQSALQQKKSEFSIIPNFWSLHQLQLILSPRLKHFPLCPCSFRRIFSSTRSPLSSSHILFCSQRAPFSIFFMGQHPCERWWMFRDLLSQICADRVLKVCHSNLMNNKWCCGDRVFAPLRGEFRHY